LHLHLLDADKYDKNNLPSNEELLKNFDEFEGDWELISKAVLDSQKTVFNELKDLSTICLTKGNVALAGDAAHAVTPNLGQGAAMGIEDGYMLAKILKSSKTLDEALKKYENARFKRVKMIRDKSFMIGKLAQSSSRIFCFIRNMTYRAMPSSMLAKDTLKTLSLKQKGF
jgi:2-heptyl-3-hydroxy-4(1H)-quinolone synthase